MKKKLLVITGVQRSGNTLLAKLIGNHSQVKMEIDPSLTTVFNAHNLLLRSLKNDELGDLNYIKRNIDKNLNNWHPDRLNNFDFSDWHPKIISNYINSKLKEGDYSYLGIKTPIYCNRLEEIELLTNEVKYINIYRDPRNVVFSQMSKINIDLVNAVYMWKQAFFMSSYYQVVLGKKKYLNLKYENLVSNPEIEIRKVCVFLNIPYKKQILNLSDKDTESEDSYILPFFDTSKFTDFKKNLTNNQIRYIESYCKEEMDLLGYRKDNNEITTKVITRKMLIFSKLKQDFINLFKSEKKHMSNNQLKTVKISIRDRFRVFVLTIINIVLPKGLFEILINNNRLNK